MMRHLLDGSFPVVMAILLLVVATQATRLTAQAPGVVEAYDLRCEARRDPLGVDRRQPRLSWKVRSGSRGQLQTRWQIVVDSTAEAAASGKGALWNSGVVDGDHTLGVRYGGRALRPHERCFWSVRVWDAQGRPSGWSEPATWTVGPLDAPLWEDAEWIGHDALRPPPRDDVEVAAGRWIGHAADRDDATPLDAPPGKRLYVGSFELPDGADIDTATLTVLADNSATCVLNGSTLFADRAGWQVAVPFDVTGLLRAGRNELRIQVTNESAGPSGLLVWVDVELDGGDALQYGTDGEWRSAEPVDEWRSGALPGEGFAPVRVLGEYGMAPWGAARDSGLRLSPVPHLRRTFRSERKVRRALLYGTALGNVDFHLNGERVSDELFTPGWTDYRIRVPYRCWDVTEMVREGDNVLGALLADGWYAGYIGWGRKRDHYGTAPRLRCVLRVEHDDGSVTAVPSDAEWRARQGPIREADFLMGERYDARLELPGWSEPGLAEGGEWQPVDVGAEHDPRLHWHPGPPVVALDREFPPVGRREPQPGVHVFDLGRNFAGVVRLKVSAPAGTEVRLRFAERLNPDGSVYVANLRGARATDTYVCKGEGVEVWQPRFTFHGFQYVEVTGLPEAPPDDAVTGVPISSDTPVVGSFECSNEMLNQLASNVHWTQRANFIEVPTDCPQRDERLGWTGDAQVYVRTATLRCDVQAFFDAWLLDLADAQRDDGQFPAVAPLIVAGSDGGPGWSDAGTIVPWAIYQTYGDRELLRRQFPSMLRYVAFCQARSKDGVLPPDRFHCYGDWLSIDAPTPKELIYTAYYARSVELTARAAEVLGEDAAAARLWALHGRIAQAFRDTFVAEDGTVRGDTQCGYVLALAFDLVGGPLRERAAERLVGRIEARDMHLSTGFLGTKDLMLVLSEIGRHDVAWTLLTNDTFPSWGFSIQHGATSIWERWDGWTPERGFQDPGMNSFAHYSFGAVYQWMVENIGGIRALAPAYGRIRIAPRPGGGVNSAQVAYESVRGRIESAWSIEAGELRLTVVVPANSEAVVALPNSDPDSVRVDGQPVTESAAQRLGVTVTGAVELAVGSGTWQFTAAAPD